MKKTLLAFVATLTTLALCTSVRAQSEDNINPVSVARALALKTPTHYHCSARGVSTVEGVSQSMIYEFVMDGKFTITNLSINGTTIPLGGEPLYGLPLSEIGITDFWIHMAAETRGHVFAGHGYISQPALMPGDSLVVTLRPSDIRKEIEIDVGIYGNDLDLEIEGWEYGYGYGVSDGHFYVYLPPLGGRYRYVLRQRSTGIVVGTGWLEPFQEVVESSNAFFGIRYPGNVQGIQFQNPNGMDDWVGIGNMQYNCRIPVNDGGLPVAGKVVFADVGMGGLEVIISGRCWVYVQQATSENGDMPFLPLVDRSTNENEMRVATQQTRLGRVVITIVPVENSGGTVWANFHRYYGVLPPVVYGASTPVAPGN